MPPTVPVWLVGTDQGEAGQRHALFGHADMGAPLPGVAQVEQAEPGRGGLGAGTPR